jgi:DNA-binding NarL/FixJ family response regulator
MPETVLFDRTFLTEIRCMPRRSHTIRVSIVEDDERLRSMYIDLLGWGDDFRVAGSYGTVQALLADISSNTPDVIIMDIGLPGMNGIEGVREVKKRFSDIDILMHSVYDDEDRVFDAICSGASGYILKNSPPEELLNAIRNAKTAAPMSASLARKVMETMRRQGFGKQPTEEYNLSDREMDVLKGLVDGLSYKQIADKHFISLLTVQSHIKKTYEKLQVHSKNEAVAKAMRSRLF